MANYNSDTNRAQIDAMSNDIIANCLSISAKTNGKCAKEIRVILDRLDFICVHAHNWAAK